MPHLPFASAYPSFAVSDSRGAFSARTVDDGALKRMGAISGSSFSRSQRFEHSQAPPSKPTTASPLVFRQAATVTNVGGDPAAMIRSSRRALRAAHQPKRRATEAREALTQLAQRGGALLQQRELAGAGACFEDVVAKDVGGDALQKGRRRECWIAAAVGVHESCDHAVGFVIFAMIHAIAIAPEPACDAIVRIIRKVDGIPCQEKSGSALVVLRSFVIVRWTSGSTVNVNLPSKLVHRCRVDVNWRLGQLSNYVAAGGELVSREERSIKIEQGLRCTTFGEEE